MVATDYAPELPEAPRRATQQMPEIAAVWQRREGSHAGGS